MRLDLILVEEHTGEVNSSSRKPERSAPISFLPAFLAAVFTFTSGCASLPDTQSFTAATAGLRRAVALSGSTVVGELKSVPHPAANAQGTKLEAAWSTRNQAMSALVDYANSLQAIADAGNKGAEAAKKLADATKALTQSLGVFSLGTSAVAELAADTFSFANGQIAKARAARSLEASLAEIQPVIERIAALFRADLQASDELVTIAITLQTDGLATKNASELGYRGQLLTTQRKIMAAIQSELVENKSPAALARVEDLNRITQMLAQMDTWNSNYESERTTIVERGRLAHEIIAATKAAFTDWASAHTRLLVATRAKRLPSVGELLEATARINELLERYHNL